jgi:hypothetical protein
MGEAQGAGRRGVWGEGGTSGGHPVAFCEPCGLPANAGTAYASALRMDEQEV